MDTSNYYPPNSNNNNSNNNNSIQYTQLKCYEELFKTYETPRLILSRTVWEDLEPLGKIILNKKINIHYQRPIIYLPTLYNATEYIKNQSNCSVCFTIKLKSYPHPIPIG